MLCACCCCCLGRLGDANALSGSLLVTAQAFSRYVSDEVSRTRRELQCCRKVFSVGGGAAASVFGGSGGVGGQATLASYLLVFFVGAFVFLLVLKVLPSRPKPTNLRWQLWLMPSSLRTMLLCCVAAGSSGRRRQVVGVLWRRPRVGGAGRRRRG